MSNDYSATQNTTSKDRKEKRPFIREACFTFFGDWASTIEQLETEQDTSSAAYTLFKAIADYSLYDIDPDFEHFPQLAIFWPMLERQIDSSVDRRRKNFADEESNERRQEVVDIIKAHPEFSCRAIQELTGVGKSTVNRIKRQYAAVKAAIHSGDGSSPSSASPSGSSNGYLPASDTSPDFYKSSSNASSHDSDTMGRDSGTLSTTQEDFAALEEEMGELPF